MYSWILILTIIIGNHLYDWVEIWKYVSIFQHKLYTCICVQCVSLCVYKIHEHRMSSVWKTQIYRSKTHTYQKYMLTCFTMLIQIPVGLIGESSIIGLPLPCLAGKLPWIHPIGCPMPAVRVFVECQLAAFAQQNSSLQPKHYKSILVGGLVAINFEFSH